VGGGVLPEGLSANFCLSRLKLFLLIALDFSG
jgi:hypothetical protein